MATKKKDAVPMQEQEQYETTALIIKTDAHLGVIDDNFDFLKVEIGKQMMKYQGLVFTDENIKEAKATKADLNRMIKTLEDNRKAIKRKWNDPYNAFEAKVKEILALIQGPLNEIDKQIVDFEDRRKAEKRESIEGEIERQLSSIIGSNQDYIRQCGIMWDDRWLNAGMSMTQVNMDISNQIGKMLRDISTIQSVCEGDTMVMELLSAYQGNKNLNLTLQMRKDLLAKREAIQRMQEEEEQRKKEAEARSAEAEARRLAESAQLEPEPIEYEEPVYEDEEADAEYEEPVSENEDEIPANNPPKIKSNSLSILYDITFKVTMDMQQMQELVNDLRIKNIPFQKLWHKKAN